MDRLAHLQVTALVLDLNPDPITYIPHGKPLAMKTAQFTMMPLLLKCFVLPLKQQRALVLVKR